MEEILRHGRWMGRSNIYLNRVPEGEERRNGAETIFEKLKAEKDFRTNGPPTYTFKKCIISQATK